MPFGVVGVLFLILLILAAVFALLSYLATPVLAMGIFFVLVCLFMILVILIQRPKGGGLAGAFGGVGGAQQTAFGAKVGDVLTWVTVGFFVTFLFLAMGLTWKIKAEEESRTDNTTATSQTEGAGGSDRTPSPVTDVPDAQTPTGAAAPAATGNGDGTADPAEAAEPDRDADPDGAVGSEAGLNGSK